MASTSNNDVSSYNSFFFSKDNTINDFPQFSRLPLELRLMIWKYCLPAQHVVELDLPKPAYSDTPCGMLSTSLANSRPGTLARVCRESHGVAVRAGGGPLQGPLPFNRPLHGDDDDFTNGPRHGGPRLPNAHPIPSNSPLHAGHPDLWPLGIGSPAAWAPWPAAAAAAAAGDVFHIHWTSDELMLRPHSGSPLRDFLEAARQHSARVSFMAGLVAAADLQPFQTGHSEEDMQILDALVDAWRCAMAAPAPAPRPLPYMVVLRTICLHMDAATAHASGLFGHLGDERVRLVPASNAAALRRFHALWRRLPRGGRDDEQVRKMFEGMQELSGVVDPRWPGLVAEWDASFVRMCVQREWALTSWDENGGGPGSAPPYGSVFTTVSVAGEQHPHMGFMAPDTHRRVVNMGNPWVGHVLRGLPQFESVVMFRWCEDRCSTLDLRTHEMFGLMHPARYT